MNAHQRRTRRRLLRDEAKRAASQMGWRVDHLIDPWRYVDAETAKSLETFDKWFVWMKDLIP